MAYDSNEVEAVTHHILEDGVRKLVVREPDGDHKVISTVGSEEVGSIKVLTQAEYDAIGSPDSSILYIIQE